MFGNDTKSAKNPPAMRMQDPFAGLQTAMNSLFGDFWRDWPGQELEATLESRLGKFTPSIDVVEKEDRYLVKAELPGIEEKDVHLSYDNNVLTLRGEKSFEKEEADPKKDRYYRERAFGSFQRSIPLNAEVDLEKVSARFKNGILSVDLPKSAPAQAKSRRINIRSES